ncbi:protein Niban-like [Scleropages formosus]|uniref:protein Niban-like n=1 Tax=Scleropages formosus TaxID=113540 RepID=UPI0008783376|nr:protein Niban-like [Scleropages formosus]
MGTLISRHLDAKDRKYLSGHTARVLRDFSSHLHLQLNAALLEREQSHMGLRDATGRQTVLQQHDTWRGGEVLLEGTVLQYADGSWRARHLQVTKDFTVESSNSSEVFEGGRPRGTPIVLSGSQICTSVREHRLLLDTACQHITGDMK